MRPEVESIANELRSWLPNYDHGPDQYPHLLFRILASLPGGEELEEMGYHSFNIGWHEMDQLGRVLDSIESKDDLEELIAALLEEDIEAA